MRALVFTALIAAMAATAALAQPLDHYNPDALHAAALERIRLGDEETACILLRRAARLAPHDERVARSLRALEEGRMDVLDSTAPPVAAAPPVQPAPRMGRPARASAAMAASLMRARACLAKLVLLLPVLVAPAACASDADWATFKKGFVEADGRVVDTGQGRISHSEGQGFAMLFAVHYDDRATFDALWQWTQRNLQVRDDALLAWRWDPQRGVTDRNNATDGDLFVAWALLRAGGQMAAAEHTAAGLRIAQDVRKRSMRKVAHGLVLVPGLEGFDKPDGQTINLSYWVFPALRDLGRADPAPEWEEASEAGITILQYSYFGRWRLPPDWLKLGEVVTPGGPPPERFGYDAVRIPIYLVWSRRETDALLKPYRDFWGHFEGTGPVPAWTNLKDDSVDSHGATQGVRAIAQLVREHPQARADRLPALDGGQSYYSAVLLLLSKVALRERGEP